jgi:hypothetical protein
VGEHDELIRKMRGRIEQCRRLAQSVTDPATRRILLDMANDGEADLKKLEAQEAARRSAD